MASELVRQLIESGIHFGHRISRWNPKMNPYIFGKRNLIHVIDIRETVKGLVRAKRFVAQVASKGDLVLFVGTKRQAREAIQKHASEANMPWVSERWLGGTLTNFRTIRSRLARLEELEAAEADGRAAEYSKKQRARITRERRKIERNLSGIRTMNRMPGAVVTIDAHRERNALREAKALGIPTICLIDTDSDPDFADIPIPGNDDAIRSINVVLEHLTTAVKEGSRAKPPSGPERSEPTARKRSHREPTARASAPESDGRSAAAEGVAESVDIEATDDVAAPAESSS